ncbi:choice-of-anchor D domain-containing protein [Dokdonia sinensis]|uniref:Choice-of-anchor D domain-containing protein n=1 Tax=Dokdonia sinensis TaxID=2479847 RepID=A0A3M0GGQ1_9FLAO|nr:LamG-like jellyroll fold domain-containing protein [Dokdonia sinensis]RMB63854.1 choice-of-anchor D domain-containing protein [Dokdonia sinensis]
MKQITLRSTLPQVCALFFFLVLFQDNVTAQYCTSNGNGNDGYTTGTRRVIFNTIDNPTPLEDNAYSDFTSIVTTVIPGDTHNLTVQVNTDGAYTVGTRVWIDWNRDDDFTDAGEEYTLGSAYNVTNGATTLSPLPITVPITASIGVTRMRVSTRYNFYPSSCGTGFDGEVEDYSLLISAGVPAPEMDVYGNSIEIANGDTTPTTADHTDFGSSNVGSPVTHTFTIQNTGTLNLTTTTPIITGSANFTLDTAPATTIGSSTSSSFTITYNPTALTTDSATVTIPNNDSDENPYTFSLRGSGIDSSSQFSVYCEDFSTAAHNWNNTTSTNGDWNRGTEATASAGASGEYIYTDRASGQYNNNAHHVFTSPTIDLSGYEKLNLSVDLWYDMSNDGSLTNPTPDGFQIQFSDDGGTTWYALGGVGEGTNWYTSKVVYNFDQITGGNYVYINGWTGNSGGWINASIDLQSQGFDNNPNVQFRVDFRSDGGTRDVGVALDNFCITGYAAATIVDPSCGPAGIGSNLALWLRADAGTGATVDGNLINNWEDQAFTTSFTNATSPSGEEPTYYDNPTNNVNFNPVLKFDPTSSSMYGKKGYYSDEFYIVVKPNTPITYSSAPNDIFCGDDYRDSAPSEDVTGFEMGDTSIRFSNDVVAFNQGPQTKYGVANVSTTQSFQNANIFNGRAKAANNGAQLYCDGNNIGNTEVNAGSFTRIENSRYWLGRSEVFGASYDGDIMEVISYSSRNSDADQQKIQSYLAIKYGITLGTNGAALDYVDSDGNVIWDASSDGASFNYDIAGIGRDDCSSLHQKQSKSVNPTSLLTFGLNDIHPTNSTNPNAFANNKNYLLWAHDNGDLGASAPIVVDMSFGVPGVNSVVDFIAVQRSWKVQETGNVGMTKISIPEIALSATITPPGKFLMFISDTPSFNPTSEYTILEPNGSNLETYYDFNGTKYITFGYAPEYYYERAVTFDGAQDYMDAGNNLNLNNSQFTISAWLKTDSNGGAIMAKRNASFTEGYELRSNLDGTVAMEWRNGGPQVVNSTTVIPVGEWHHVAVTYGGGLANLYIDGILDTAAALGNPTANNQSFTIGAADGANPSDFFEGTVDEVRVWNQSLTVDQLRYIMNQEIQQHGDGTVDGKIVPQGISKNNVSTISWTNLAGYFPMNRYTFTNVKDESGNGLVAAIKNLDTVDEQTAPLPYVSTADGIWTADATWENGSNFQHPAAVSIVDNTQTVDWNIVQTSHNVNTQTNNTVLSLEVLANELSVENDSKIEVSHYLRLNGLMDLVGESQLVQTLNSDLELTSSGSLERDQQGTADKFTYNYWCSPVSTINASALNQDFSIGSLMRDGSDVNNPMAISYTGGYDGSPGTPITLSAYWFFKYANQPSSTYANWQYVGPYGTMKAGEGWTMKGPGTGTITDPQNYTFVGKPNNSTTAQEIALHVNADNDYLIGNPFASALDANDFINDNPHLDGTLYFWEHWGGGSHYLQQYQGGYAMYNLSGGTPAVSHPEVSSTGSGTKVPERYVPVGQGFFVKAQSTGTINLSNTQRNFVKEGASSIFLNAENKAASDDSTYQNDDTIFDAEDVRTKFRFVYDVPEGIRRELLLTLDNNTTFDYDNGYDGVISDMQDDDMTWTVADRNAVIQGAPNVIDQTIFPLYVKVAASGKRIIRLKSVDFAEAPENQTIFLWDQLTDHYTNLRTGEFVIHLESGVYSDRFAIVFETKDDTSEEEEETEEEETEEGEDEENESDQDNEDEDEESDQDDETEIEDDNEETSEDDETLSLEDNLNDTSGITAYFSPNDNAVHIENKDQLTIERIALYNIAGQLVIKLSPQTNLPSLRIPIHDFSTGVYLINVTTPEGIYGHKLVIK